MESGELPKIRAMHICPKCKNDLAAGADAGRPTLCQNCKGLRASKGRILPVRRQQKVSGRASINSFLTNSPLPDRR